MSAVLPIKDCTLETHAPRVELETRPLDANKDLEASVSAKELCDDADRLVRKVPRARMAAAA
jgi:hypothetical protein